VRDEPSELRTGNIVVDDRSRLPAAAAFGLALSAGNALGDMPGAIEAYSASLQFERVTSTLRCEAEALLRAPCPS